MADDSIERSRGILSFRLRPEVIPAQTDSKQSEPSAHVIEYLLIQHKHGKHWAFPKGHPEPGETALENAIREFEEETGISRKTLILLDHRSSHPDHFSEKYRKPRRDGTFNDKISSYFIGQVPFEWSDKVIIQESEVCAFDWLPLSEACKRLTFDNGRDMLRTAHSVIQTHLAGQSVLLNKSDAS